MDQLPEVRWGVLVLFSYLAGVFLRNAAIAQKRRWAWGRMGSGAPLSRMSFGVIGALFLCMALILGLAWTVVPLFLVGWFALNFIAFLAVGFLDSRGWKGSRE